MNMFELGERPYTESDAEWDAFVAQHPHGSLLQTAVWARLKNRFGWTSQRVWVKQNGKIVAGAQMLIKGYAMGIVRIGYVPHGPLVDWSDQEVVNLTLNQIDQAAFRDRVAFVKLEPLLWQENLDRDRWQALCSEHNLLPDRDTIQPPRTVRIDLSGSEEEILAGMKQKTRYNIRLAARKEVTVRQGSMADIPLFNQLMRQTGSRNAFGIHDPKYYEVAFDQFDTLLPGSVALFIAEYEQKPLAAVMAFAHGTQGAYLYGASSNEERERMPTYAVQWAAIQWAKAQGCRWYDMWGVPDQSQSELEATFKERNDGLWGVYRFKRGWGGRVDRTVGAADRVYNRLTYRLYQWRRGRQGNSSE